MPQPSHQYPVLLFPLRLETRFDGNELLIRVFPDNILVHAHDQRLSAEESQVLDEYRDAIGRIAPDGNPSAAWRALVQRVGSRRAAYLASILGDVSASGGDNKLNGIPRASLLPDSFAAYLHTNGKPPRSVRWDVNLPPEDLPLFAEEEATTEAAKQEKVTGLTDYLFGRHADWVTDFAAAEKIGMAVRVPDVADHYSRLVVVGLSSSDADQGGEALASLLRSQRFSSGVALVPYGTPTNNTSSLQSGYANDENDAESSYQLECRAQALGESSLGVQLAEALGLERAVFANIAHAADEADILGKALRTLLWPALGDYFVTHLLTDPSPLIGRNLDPDKARRALWEYFREFVTARGPLPAMRVGKQPYGVMPVSAIRTWEPSEFDSLAPQNATYLRQFDGYLHKVLQELFDRWLFDANASVPRIGQAKDIDQELLAILSMQPASVAVHLRTLVDDRFMGWAFSECDEGSVESNTDPECGTLEDCTRWWVDQFASPREPAKAMLNDIKPELAEANINRLFGWGDYAPALDDLDIPFIRDSDDKPLDYLEAFFRFIQGDNAEPPPAQDKNKPFFYDLLRRAVVYEPSLVDKQSEKSKGIVTEALQCVAAEAIADPPGFEGAVREVLDLHSHRLDAWISSLATRRLYAMRMSPGVGAPSGLGTGVYGWVENLQRSQRISRDKPGGYIHAPSTGQAAAGAVLRNAYLSHSENSDANPYQINLSSERVRRAWRLLQGIREGQELGALLGYQFERGLHDTQNDRYIDDFRETYPHMARKSDQADTGDPAETIIARNVVDGLALARAWMEYRDEEDAADILADDERTDECEALRTELNRLSDTLDAVLDLLMYESVYQQVQGNYERSAAALDAMAGEGLPPEPEFVQTPKAGTAFTQRLCLMLQAVDGSPSIAPGNGPRTMAEPTLAGWFAEILGDPGEIGCTAWVTSYRNEAGVVYQALDLNEATEAELAALDGIGDDLAHAIVLDRESNGPFENAMQLTRSSLQVSEEFVKSLNSSVGVGAAQVISLKDLDLDPIDLLYLSAKLPEALLSSLGFEEPTDNERRAGETELEARIKYHVRATNWLGPNCEIAIDFMPPSRVCPRSLADAIEVSRSVQALLSGGRYLQPSSLCQADESDGIEQFLRVDFRELENRIDNAVRHLEILEPDQFLDFSRYGIEGAIPCSPVADSDYGDRVAAMLKAKQRRLEECQAIRSEAMKYANTDPLDTESETEASDWGKAIEICLGAMKALFGEAFIALPTMSFTQQEDFFDESSLRIEDEQRVQLWLQQVAQTRPAVYRLEDALLVTEAWQTPPISTGPNGVVDAAGLDASQNKRLRVAQLSEDDVPYWLALSDDEIAANLSVDEKKKLEKEIAEDGWPHGILSLVSWVPQPLDMTRKVSGLLVDEWNELIPSSTRTTGISFQYDGPNSQAPQALLLAVPATRPGDETLSWTMDELHEIVNDTLDLAKVRTVDIDAMDAAVNGIFPAGILPSDAGRPGWEREVVEKLNQGLFDAIRDRLHEVLKSDLRVKVEDQKGKPLDRVKVKLGDRTDSYETNADGIVDFSDLSIKSYTVAVEHSNYKRSDPKSVAVRYSSNPTEVLFRLSLILGAIKGKVTAVYKRGEKPRAARGSTVTLMNSNDQTIDDSRVTEDGEYAFANLMPGRYKVKAELLKGRIEGCSSATVSVTLPEGGGDKEVNLGLDCVPDLGHPTGGGGVDRERP